MAGTARKAFVVTLVGVAVVAGALALWKLKLVLSLVFLPAGFPSICPAPGLLASIYGYLPVHSGGVVVRPATP